MTTSRHRHTQTTTIMTGSIQSIRPLATEWIEPLLVDPEGSRSACC
jgi:hypothetical protein